MGHYWPSQVFLRLLESWFYVECLQKALGNNLPNIFFLKKVGSLLKTGAGEWPNATLQLIQRQKMVYGAQFHHPQPD